MTLPSSGQLSLADINGEFGLGTDLGSYRGVTWYTDAGSSGTFTNTNLGVDQFYGKRATAPISIAYVTSTYSSANNTSYSFAGVSFGSAPGARKVVIGVMTNNAGNTTVNLTSASIGGVSASIDLQQAIFGDGRPCVAIISASVPGGTTSGTVSLTFDTSRGGCSIGVYNIPGATAWDGSAWSGIGVDVTTQTADLGSYVSGYPRAVVAVAGTLDGSVANMSFSGSLSGRDYQNNWGSTVTAAGKGALVASNANLGVSYGITANWARLAAAAYK